MRRTWIDDLLDKTTPYFVRFVCKHPVLLRRVGFHAKMQMSCPMSTLNEIAPDIVDELCTGCHHESTPLPWEPCKSCSTIATNFKPRS